MQNFEKSRREGEKHTRTTQIRHSEDLGELIASAATALGVDKSVFLRAAIEREASRVLTTRSSHTLTPEDAKRFAAALDPPPEPTPKALAAAKAYRDRVIHAD